MPITLTREKPGAVARAAVCAGCDQPLRADESYCPTCGAARPERITLARLFSEARGKLIDLDFKLIRTLRDLVRAPGTAARRYIEGNRQQLSNPIWFAFLATTAYIAANNFLTRGVSRVFNPLVNTRACGPTCFSSRLCRAPLQRMLFRKAGYNLRRRTRSLCWYAVSSCSRKPYIRCYDRLALGCRARSWKRLFRVGDYGFVRDRRPVVWLRA
jgi:hypothetical protein